MTCDRCGHKHDVPLWSTGWLPEYKKCIANLRADLAQIRAAAIALLDDLESERRRSWQGWAQAAALRDALDTLGIEHWDFGLALADVHAELELERERSWTGWEKAVAMYEFAGMLCDLLPIPVRRPSWLVFRGPLPDGS